MQHTKGSSATQGPLWGTRARDWAEIQEHTAHVLYGDALAALALNKGSTLLDAGCSSGVFCEQAAALDLTVSGLDASEPLLALARIRVPSARFVLGDVEALPFADHAFEVVTAFNSYQYAASPLNALREAHRVLKPGGRLVMATWGRPEDCEATTYLRALAAFLPPPSPGAPGPFALAADGAMVALTQQAGFTLVTEQQALTIWNYANEAVALRGLLSSGPAVRAMAHAGEFPVITAVRAMLAKFRQPSGHFILRNAFRYVIVRR